MTNIKKGLFITPCLPRPVIDGATSRTWRLLSSLCEEYEVSLACPVFPDESERAMEVQASLGIKQLLTVNTVTSVPGGKRYHCIDFKPAESGFKAAMFDDLKAKIGGLAGTFDILIADHHDSLPYLPEKMPTDEFLCIYHAHPAEFRSRGSTTKDRSTSLSDIEVWRSVKQALIGEINACSGVDMVFADRQDLLAFADQGVPLAKLRQSPHPLKNENLRAGGKSGFDDREKKLVYGWYRGQEGNMASAAEMTEKM